MHSMLRMEKANPTAMQNFSLLTSALSLNLTRITRVILLPSILRMEKAYQSNELQDYSRDPFAIHFENGKAQSAFSGLYFLFVETL